MRNYRQRVTMAIISVFLILGFANSRADNNPCESIEYKLMSMLIDDEYESEFSLILINHDTEPWCITGRLDVLRKEWPRLRNETIDSLIVTNRGSADRLDKHFCLPVEYRLVSEEEYSKVLGEGRRVISASASAGTGMEQYTSVGTSGRPDWNNFDRVFPDAQGYLTFSRIGFDSDHTQALVIFSNSYRCSGDRVRPAKRKIAFFMKREGTWRLVGISRGIDSMY